MLLELHAWNGLRMVLHMCGVGTYNIKQPNPAYINHAM